VKDPPAPGELAFNYSVLAPACNAGSRDLSLDWSHSTVCTTFADYLQNLWLLAVLLVSNILLFVFSVVLYNAAIKDMASNIERRWRQMLAETPSKQTELNTSEGESRQVVLPSTTY
jgi:hypothetical protein